MLLAGGEEKEPFCHTPEQPVLSKASALRRSCLTRASPAGSASKPPWPGRGNFPAGAWPSTWEKGNARLQGTLMEKHSAELRNAHEAPGPEAQAHREE